MSIEHIEVNGNELTAFDLPPEPTDTYTVHVDGLGDVVVEKGKPPKEKDVPAMYMRKLVPELCEQNAELHRENAKLRELIQKTWKWERNGCYECPLEKDCKVLCVYDGDCGIAVEIEKGLQELGVEVDA